MAGGRSRRRREASFQGLARTLESAFAHQGESFGQPLVPSTNHVAPVELPGSDCALMHELPASVLRREFQAEMAGHIGGNWQFVLRERRDPDGPLHGLDVSPRDAETLEKLAGQGDSEARVRMIGRAEHGFVAEMLFYKLGYAEPRDPVALPLLIEPDLMETVEIDGRVHVELQIALDRGLRIDPGLDHTIEPRIARLGTVRSGLQIRARWVIRVRLTGEGPKKAAIYDRHPYPLGPGVALGNIGFGFKIQPLLDHHVGSLDRKPIGFGDVFVSSDKDQPLMDRFANKTGVKII